MDDMAGYNSYVNTYIEDSLAVQELIDVLPMHLADWVRSRTGIIIEIVLDYGREPEVRYLDAFELLDGYKVTGKDIDYILTHQNVTTFAKNNRCGIDGTLHRISAIRDRMGMVLGLTLRVGRTISGGIELIRDLIDTGESILFLGRPGVGKTSKLREACRYLSSDKNQHVVIVDTSNEIAGEGPIPHKGVGRSRRMMVPYDKGQQEIMVEAVENHLPNVIVIDEMSKEAEAYAARTVAERGVQLLATAHGETLSNLFINRPLTILVGNINAVTISDNEAKKSDGRKTVLERESAPTFTKLVELIDYDTIGVHHDVAKSVDYMLQGYTVVPELRQLVDNRMVILAPERFITPPTHIVEEKITEEEVVHKSRIIQKSTQKPRQTRR